MQQDLNKKMEDFASKYLLLKKKKGELLYGPEQDKPEHVYFLKRGFVKEYALSPDGEELIIHIFVPSTCFSMASALAEVANRYYLEALTDIEAYMIPNEKIKSFLDSNPDVLMDLTKRALKGLAGLSFRLEISSFGNTYKRVVSTLLYLANHFGIRKANSVQFEYKFSHSEIASLIGISRERVSLEIEKLEKKNLLSYKDHIIAIPEIELLKKEL